MKVLVDEMSNSECHSRQADLRKIMEYHLYMKVAIYQEMKTQSEAEDFEVYNALKRRNDIESVTFVNPKKLKIRILDGEISFEIGEIALHKANFDVLFVRGGFTNKPTLIEVVKHCRKNGIKVFDNNFSEIKYLINKRADYIKLGEAGIIIPNTYIFSNDEDILDSNLQYPLVMKTTNTGKGKNIFMVHSNEEVIEICMQKEKSIESFVLQELIDYEHDLRVLVCGDKVLGCMKRIPKNGDFRANFSLGGNVEPFEATSEIKNLAIKAARACELDIAGVDILVERNNGKLWCLEANRTPGLKAITQALGQQISDKVVEFMLKNAN